MAWIPGKKENLRENLETWRLYLAKSSILLCWERSREGVTSGWPWNCIRAIRGSLPLSGTWNVGSTLNSHSRSHFQGHSLERAKCYWDHLDGVRDLAPLRPLSNKILVGWLMWRFTHPVVPITSLLSKFPRFWHLPSTTLDGASLSQASPCPRRGMVSDITWEAPEVVAQHARGRVVSDALFWGLP